MYENKDICGKCGGKCCRDMPGCNYPDDFGLPNTDKLTASIKSGLYSVDWYEGDPREGKDELSQAYYVRPAIKGNERKVYDPSWGGPCTFLGESGCKLSEDERPRECRHLEPKEGHAGENCHMHGNHGKRDAAIAWLPYKDILVNL